MLSQARRGRLRGLKNLATMFVVCAFSLTLNNCGEAQKVEDLVQQAIDAFSKAQDAITKQSDAWRQALPDAINQVDGVESHAAGDVKDVITDSKNQASELVADSIKMANINGQEIIAKTGVEFRCNVEFASMGLTARVQSIIDDLKFWKEHKTRRTVKPVHSVCQIVGDTLQLQQVGPDQFSLDSTKLMNPGMIGIFGYNFRPDAIPHLSLIDAQGKQLRPLSVLPAYVTQYQLMIDFAGESFDGAVPRSRIRLTWPDGGDPQDVSLAITSKSKLKIVKTQFSPARPVANTDRVTLSVTIQNIGGQKSGGFDLKWAPPDGSRLQTVNQGEMASGESRVVVFPDTCVYANAGTGQNTVSISTGDDTEVVGVKVFSQTPPPPTIVHQRILLFWNNDNPGYLFIVDAKKSADNINKAGYEQNGYIKELCDGIFTPGDYRNIKIYNPWDHEQNNKSLPTLPHISRAERNLKACIRDQGIILDPHLVPDLAGGYLPPVHANWPNTMCDQLWFIVECDGPPPKTK